MAGIWSQAGDSCSTKPAGFWLSSVSKDRWPEQALEANGSPRNWDDQVGDRRQELVLIGVDMNKQALIAGFAYFIGINIILYISCIRSDIKKFLELLL